MVVSLSLFFSFSVAQVLVELRKKFMNNFVFPTWACTDDFNNNNNNNNLLILCTLCCAGMCTAQEERVSSYPVCHEAMQDIVFPYPVH